MMRALEPAELHGVDAHPDAKLPIPDQPRRGAILEQFILPER